MIDKIIDKIEKGKSLTDKEIETYLNNGSGVAVYGFSQSIGHLTLYGKNKMVEGYKDEIIEELYRIRFGQ